MVQTSAITLAAIQWTSYSYGWTELSNEVALYPTSFVFSLSILYLIPVIFFSVQSQDRIVVVREPDGTLRTANWDEHDRMNQVYLPRERRVMHMPEMFLDKNLPVSYVVRQKNPQIFGMWLYSICLLEARLAKFWSGFLFIYLFFNFLTAFLFWSWKIKQNQLNKSIVKWSNGFSIQYNSARWKCQWQWTLKLLFISLFWHREIFQKFPSFCKKA